MGDALPADVGAWHAAAAPVHFAGSDAVKFSGPSDAAILQELGFVGAQRREYAQGDKRMTIEAMRLHDSSGAYGVFTWYRKPGWRQEDSKPGGTRSYQAAIGPDEAVMQRNGFIVHVLHYAPTPLEMERLAVAMPTFSNDPLPDLPGFLPTQGIVKFSEKYGFGPQVFAHLAPQVSPSALGFSMGAEAIAAEYRLPGRGPMTLVMAIYPTPQLAQKYAKEIGALNLPNVELRRSGSLIYFVPDAAHKSDADKLLGLVRYGMVVMMNETVPKVTVKSFMKMLESIFALCGILLLFCALSGLLYGLIRVLARRTYPGQVFDRDVEVIELHLNR